MSTKSLKQRRQEVTDRENAVSQRELELERREVTFLERERALNDFENKLNMKSATVSQADTDFDVKVNAIRQEAVVRCVEAVTSVLKSTGVSTARVETFEDFRGLSTQYQN